MAKKTPKSSSSEKITRRKQRLGKGLRSLMGDPVQITHPHQASDIDHDPGSINSSSKPDFGGKPGLGANTMDHSNDGIDSTQVVLIDIDSLKVNPHQPRQDFDDTALQQLAESIRNEGVIQPLIVRPAIGAAATPESLINNENKAIYELVAGERRWRAAKLVGLAQVPALVRDLDDRQMAEWSLIENLQREDLNPIERAEAFEHLMHQFALSHDQIAARVGVERSSVSNSLRLLNLTSKVRGWVRQGKILAGQAKVLAGIIDPRQQEIVAGHALAKELSVRQLEKWVSQLRDTVTASDLTNTPTLTSGGKPAFLSDLEHTIGRQLGTRVKIRKGKKKGSGSLQIEFYSLDEFDALMARLEVSTEVEAF